MGALDDHFAQYVFHEQPMPLFCGTGSERMSAPHREATEDISVHFLTVEEVRSLLQHNEIKQAMLAPLWRYFAEHHLW